MKKNLVKQTVLGIGILSLVAGTGIAAIAAPTPAYAEEAASTTESAAPSVDDIVVTGRDTDVVISGVNAPGAKYGTGTNISFKAKAKGGTISAIYPVISDGFPFETNDAAYQVTEGNANTQELVANYNFTVRGDVQSGYTPVTFAIEYVKNGSEYTIIKTINVSLEGAPTTEATTEAVPDKTNVSTPRVIVTGYSIDKKELVAGDTFKLTLHLKNTAKRTISNMKVTIGTEKGEFLPTSGSATQFVQSLGAGQNVDLETEMSALANLEPRPYVLTVNCVYEDGEANPFESTENISIPVNQFTNLKFTDLSISPDPIAIDSESNISFSINNLGKAQLSNVQVDIESDVIKCPEGSFVGNIAAGASGYADLMVTGVKDTAGEPVKVKVIVSFEDAMGLPQTYEDTIEVTVSEEGGFSGEEEFYEEEYTEPVGLPVWAKVLIGVGIALVVAAIVAVIVIINVVKKKKSQKEAEELEAELEELDEEADDKE